MLRKKTANATKPSSWGAVRKNPHVTNAPPAVSAVIRAIAAATSLNLDYTDGADLVRQATDLVDNPTARLVAIVNEPTLVLLETYWTDTGVDYGGLAKDLAGRRRKLTALPFTEKVVISEPTLPPRYPGPTAAKLKPSSRDGRSDGAFHRVPNAMDELGGQTTSNVNQELAEEEKQRGNLVPIGEKKEVVVQVCPSCSRPMDADLFEVDHQDAFSHIRDQLWKLADEMTMDDDLAEKVETSLADNFGLYFVSTRTGRGRKTTVALEPTRYAMGVFSNDLGNLLRLCRKCNGPLGKSDMDILDWYRENELYGPAFIAHYVDARTAQQIPMRARGMGWGEAVREWFDTHHWPVLQKIIPVVHFQEVMNEKLKEEAVTKLRATTTRRTSEADRLTDRGEQLGRQNTISVGMTEVLTKDRIRDDQPRIGENSPEADVRGFSEFRQQQVLARVRKRLMETAEFEAGLADAYARRPDASATYPDVEDLDRYQEGWAAGKAKALAERELGYAEGVLGTRSMKRTASRFYDHGFEKGRQRSDSVATRGRRHGAAKAELDSAVAVDEPGAALLMQAYMTGYNEGRRGQKV